MPGKAADRLRAGGRVAHPAIWLIEESYPNARAFDSRDSCMQLPFVCDTEYDQIAGSLRLAETLSRFQAGMAGLNDLVRNGNICPNQDVGIEFGTLFIGHGRSPGWQR